VLEQRPLEVAFVRDPLTHLVSAAGQQKWCLTSNKIARHTFGNSSILKSADEVIASLQRLLSHSSQSAGGFNTTDCAKHMFPQGSGYAFDPAGTGRLHFVGRVEHLRDDWQRLLTLLGDSTAHRPPSIPKRNARDHSRGNPDSPFAPGGAAWRALEASPLVQRLTAYDRACFGYPPSSQPRTV
jgi:hypothetical protein